PSKSLRARSPPPYASRPRASGLSGTDQPAGSSPLRESSGHLEEAGRAHSAADAHGSDDVLHLAPTALDQGMTGEPGARHPVRMADGDGAAVEVEPVVRDAEPVAAVDDLHGKRFVQLPEPDVVRLQASALQEARHSEHWA